MSEPTQGPEGVSPVETQPAEGPPPSDHAPAAPLAAGAGVPVADPVAETSRRAGALRRGLLAWLGIVAGGGSVAALFGHVEAALLFAGAGAFALAQASDVAAMLQGYRAFVDHEMPIGTARGLLVRVLAGSLVPLGGAAFYAVLGAYAWSGSSGTAQPVAAIWSAAAAVICAVLAWRPASDAVTSLLFRGEPDRTRRLTTTIVVMALLMPVPAGAIVRPLLSGLVEGGVQLVDPPSLLAQLLGEVAIGLAGIGWLLRRDGRATLERLGLSALKPVHLLVVVLGVAAAIGLNAATEWLELRVFPELWRQDADLTRLIVGDLSLTTALLLGICAGIGEEVVVRGALQPRLGIVLSAVVFATGHVQYSWYGMGVVGLLGALLGVIRARTNTTTAIAVHVLYDVFAAVTTGG